MTQLQEKIYSYTAFFELNENGGYTVTVPSLPGLVTEGEDLSQAKLMAEDAIRCYVEGLVKADEEVPVEGETAQVKLNVKV